jgi:hypothetical protein
MKNVVINSEKRKLHKALGLGKKISTIHDANIVVAEKIVNLHGEQDKKNKYKMTDAIVDIIRESRIMSGSKYGLELPITEHEAIIAYRCLTLRHYQNVAENKKLMIGVETAVHALRKYLGKERISFQPGGIISGGNISFEGRINDPLIVEQLEKFRTGFKKEEPAKDQQKSEQDDQKTEDSERPKS